MKNEKPVEVWFEGADTDIYGVTKEFSKDLVDEFKLIKETLFQDFKKVSVRAVSGASRAYRKTVEEECRGRHTINIIPIPVCASR